MTITIESDNFENEYISAFAYTIGKSIEEVIKEKTNNLEEENNILQAKILSFKGYNNKEEYYNHFGINILPTRKI